MAALKAELKRSFLQSIADAVEDGIAQQEMPSTVPGQQDAPIVTLGAGLKAFQRMGFEALKGGKLSLGSAGFNHEVKWAPPMHWRSFSQDEVFVMAQEFREVFNDAISTLADAGNSSPTDATILATMMADDRLQTVTSQQHDYSMLRRSGRY